MVMDSFGLSFYLFVSSNEQVGRQEVQLGILISLGVVVLGH